jgi:hypothetical protein
VAVQAHTDARHAALARLIDHAALFPPASMAVADALAEDRRVRAGAEGWIVNRFVCPASQLDALGPARLPLAVVLDTDAHGRLDDPRVEAVEVPPGRDPGPVTELAAEIYVERPLEELSWLDLLAASGLRAKVRCGGGAVPPVAALAAFVRSCRGLSLSFKATAGLHHPVRREGEHGFLNLLAAALFGDEEEALAEEDPGAFRLDRDVFAWRGREAAPPEVARARAELFVGFGSCSVREPVDELRALGVL